ncbi:hypothetical protein E1O_26800 [Burkholderiales bacterium GJ-E10]|nr:hypothetical protein E1O_26800 [Burkholderiales bacterium GJ-E10]
MGIEVNFIVGLSFGTSASADADNTVAAIKNPTFFNIFFSDEGRIKPTPPGPGQWGSATILTPSP